MGSAYARLLAEAAQKLGSTPAYYALWPTQKLQQPWQLTVPALYKAMAWERVAFSATSGGQWLLPGEAIYCDAAVDRCFFHCVANRMVNISSQERLHANLEANLCHTQKDHFSPVRHRESGLEFFPRRLSRSVPALHARQRYLCSCNTAASPSPTPVTVHA